MASLAEIRAKLKEQENRSNNNQSNSGSDNAVYPFWNIAEGESATFRFLPDGNESNDFFWAERAMIRLPFNGVKGETDNRQVVVQVPCMEMYGKKCPILGEVRQWFKDPSLEDMGRKYWKKRSYLFQGFVRENPLSDDVTPENPIRRFIIGPQIFQIIKASILDPDLEELPTDYTAGLDFRLYKTSKGGYADYSTSKWARKESELSDAEMKAINDHGLFNLSDFIPKMPSDEELAAIVEMFEASVDGEAYDPDRWSQFYRPSGMAQSSGSSTSARASAAKASASSDDDMDDEVPFKSESVNRESATTGSSAEADSGETSGGNAQDILKMIRSRQTQ